jgi:hypothetical protein
LLERGLACPAYQPYGAPLLERATPSYLWAGDASWLMVFRARHDRRQSRVEAAWHDCADLVNLGSLIAVRPRSFVEHAVGLTVVGRGLVEVRQLLGDSSATEQRLTQLLDHLVTTDVLDEGWSRAIRTEYQFLAEAIEDRHLIKGRSFWPCRYMYQPNRTKRMCAEFLREVGQSASLPCAQVRVPEFNPLPASHAGRRVAFLRPNGAGRILAAMLISPEQFEHVVKGKCSTESDLDGLRLVLVCRLYEIRHGRLPATLAALVPEFLRQVPQDPFDGRPFRYLPDKAVVYSVGPDLVDSSTSGEAASSEPVASRARRSDDLVYPIHAKAE